MLPDVEEIQAEREEKIQRDLSFFSRSLSFFICLPKPKRQKRTNINRDYYGAQERLVAAYFSDNSMFPEAVFEDRFRMSRSLFTEISPLIKCTSAIRQLAYDTVPEALNEYLQMDSKEAISPKWYPEEEHQPDDLLRSDEQRYRVIRSEFGVRPDSEYETD
nr:hypothetical protein [Tanacetum cinerariifolium]